MTWLRCAFAGLFLAVAACGGKAGDVPDDAGVTHPHADAAPKPDATPPPPGAQTGGGTLPGTGRVTGGTVTMDVEVAVPGTPATVQGGTVTMEVQEAGTSQ
jgi:hypothetical protein